MRRQLSSLGVFRENRPPHGTRNHAFRDLILNLSDSRLQHQHLSTHASVAVLQCLHLRREPLLEYGEPRINVIQLLLIRCFLAYQILVA